ncbi:MAG TPA: hypothetical protein VFG14_17570, partial [Chthoniobacteraceae bacterium]|nr:hypothetical protein [Chthoniobacteraceae bacterium]
MQKLIFTLIIALLALVAGAARMWNVRDVFQEGRIYFTESDAYSRMTRVRMIAEGQDWTIRHHSFENWPEGTKPHTTAPMDWTILSLRPAVSVALAMIDPGKTSVLRGEAIDLAGALAGPLLGILTCLAVAFALPKESARERWFVIATVLVLAVSSIIVHGTLLGRPDHQSLLIFLLGFAMAAEIRLVRSVTRPWAMAAGAAWGLALWVSLYEPLILLAATLLGSSFSTPNLFRDWARRAGWTVTGAIFLLGVVIDGWRITLPDAGMREAFGRWKLSIGEMQPLNLSDGTLWNWAGWLIVLAPVSLAWQWRQRPECRVALVLLLTTFALTLWQIRWGYFLVLAFALTLPLQLSAAPRPWIGWIGFFVGIWPLLGDWDRRLYPDEGEERRRFVARSEQKALRE